MKTIQRYEHQKLIIGSDGFKKHHWDSFVKLNILHNEKYFRILHNGIQFKQYVGVIQVGNFTVQINPKADKTDDDNRWSSVLIDMLKKCRRIKAQTNDSVNLKKQPLNLLDIYFEYYLREVEQLIHKGLVKKYRKETNNVKSLKGKLDFAGNIRHNLIHKERFYTTHQVYDTDHRLHQVLNLALEIVDQFTSGTRISDQCKRILMRFPEVEKIKVNETILNTIRLDRKTAPYERALELAKFIILNYSPDIVGGDQKMIALLFDMNQLWEEYIYITLINEIHKEGSIYKEYQIRAQHKKGFWGNNSLQPDIVLEKGKEVYIIDTKWKLPDNSASIEDLRQMYAYARFWHADKVMLLYPGDRSHSGFKEYKNQEKDGIKHECQMAFVTVLNLKDGKLDKEIGAKILKLIAG